MSDATEEQRQAARLRTGQVQYRRAQDFASRGRDDLARIQLVRAERNGVTAQNAWGQNGNAGRDRPAIRGATFEGATRTAPRARPQFQPPPPSQMTAGGRGFIAPPDEAKVEGGNTGSAVDGKAGDMMYHDGETWVVLDCPTVEVENPALRHNGTAPYWETPGCD